MIRDRKESDLCALSGQNTALFALASEAGRALCGVRVGGTFRNRFENEAESQQERRSLREGMRAPVGATESAVAWFARAWLALTKRLPRRRHGCGNSAIGGCGRGPLFASAGTHATSTTATAEARNAGNLALPPGQ